MTSKKMNTLMLQRYEASIRFPNSPRSDSAIASPNQRQSTHAKAARLRLNTMGAHVWPLIQPASENITPSNASRARRMPRHRGHKVVRTVLGNVHPDSLRRSAPPHWQDAPLLPVQVVRQGALRRQCGGVERLMIYLTTGGLSKV